MKKNITKKYIKEVVFMIEGFLLIYGVVWSCSNLFSVRKVDNPKDVLSINFAGDGIEMNTGHIINSRMMRNIRHHVNR